MPEEEIELCDKCKKEPAEEIHYCPYQSDVRDNDDFTCNCCDGCRANCLEDI